MSDPQEITFTDIKYATYKTMFPHWLSDEFLNLIGFNIDCRDVSEYLEIFEPYFTIFYDLIDTSHPKRQCTLKQALTAFSKKKGTCATVAKAILKEKLSYRAEINLTSMLCTIVANDFELTCKPEYSGLDQDLLEDILNRFFLLLYKFAPDISKFKTPFTYIKPNKIEPRTDYSDHLIITKRRYSVALELRDMVIDQKKSFMIMDIDPWIDLFFTLKLTNCTLEYDRFCQDYCRQFIMENCTINKPCIVGSYLVKDEDHISNITLNNCIINSDFKYHTGGKSGSITLNNCVIESNGSVEIKEVKEPMLLARSVEFLMEHGGKNIPNPYEGENTLNQQPINIKNCIFKGKLDCSDSYFDCDSSIQYTTFYDNFIFKNSRFDKDCIIEHLAFPTIDNATTNKCKKVLIEALKASDRTENELIKDLELKNEEKETWGAGFAKERDNQIGNQLGDELSDIKSQLTRLNTSNAEDTEYNDQIKRNRITTKNAAKYLGIGISTLEKKRANDKKQIVQDSIPCILLNGTIYYRKDALDAYLFGQNCSDWGLLADLQAKYKEVWQDALNYKKKE